MISEMNCSNAGTRRVGVNRNGQRMRLSRAALITLPVQIDDSDLVPSFQQVTIQLRHIAATL